MKNSRIGVLSAALPLCLGLSLALVACGGDSDSNGNKSPDGSGGTTGTTGGTSTGGSKSPSGGSDSKAGSTGNVDKGGTGNEPGESNLPGDKPLNELTDDELQELCDEVATEFSGDTFSDLACRMGSAIAALASGATTDAEAQAACKAAYDLCEEEPPTTTQTCTKPGSACTATVDDFQACLEDTSNGVAALNDAIPDCDQLKLGDLTKFLGAAGSLMSPPSCTAYQEECSGGPSAGAGDALP